MATESPIDTLFREAQELRDNAIGKAIAFRKRANETSPGLYGSISRWTHSILREQGEFDTSSFIEKNSDAYKLLQQNKIDVSAIRVPQRGIAALNGDQILGDQKLGTDNLQQCVAVVAHGFTTRGEEKAVLMHVDKYTSLESVENALSQFENNEYLRIIIYGGKDQYRKTYDPQTRTQREEHSMRREVSLDNLRIVDEIITNLGLEARIDREQSKRGRDVPSANFIYYPNYARTIEDVFPNGGFEIAEATEKVRRAQNFDKGREIDSGQVSSSSDRTALLQEVPTDSLGTTPKITPELQYRLLKYYQAKGCKEFENEIENAQSQVSEGAKEVLMKASSSCQNFILMIQELLKPSQVELKDILEKSTRVEELGTKKIGQFEAKKMIKGFSRPDSLVVIGHGRSIRTDIKLRPQSGRGHGKPL